ncbi:MAG: GSCFA domain-containing protein [Paramuribaculum sp.]|nr:GSCFA domain-containing protein [Paramuribaculum sp.]
MAEFRTPVAPLCYAGSISHTTPLLMLGSCFAANIGAKLEKDFFDVIVNPFGTLYNPASIAAACERIATGRRFTENDIVERDGLLHSWDCHSSLSSSSPDQELFIGTLNRMLYDLRVKIASVSTVILTFGTRHIFRLKESGKVVANCHKFPAATFEEEDLDVERCTAMISIAAKQLRQLNPEMRVILTVSPVRYVGEGLHNSTLSKSTLLLACDAVVKSHEDIIYFPSYEILMDDLRDYRFYAADMKHPSEVAADYIYEIFSRSFFDKKTIDIANRCRRLAARLSHRPITGVPDESFALKTRELAANITMEFPELTQRINKIITQ